MSDNEILMALKTLFDDYKQLADSGDAGNWRLEETEAGALALSVINKYYTAVENNTEIKALFADKKLGVLDFTDERIAYRAGWNACRNAFMARAEESYTPYELLQMGDI